MDKTPPTNEPEEGFGSRDLQNPDAMEDFEKRRQKRRLQRTLRRGLVLFGAVCVILLVAWGITAIINTARGEPETETLVPSDAPVIMAGSDAVPDPLPDTPDNTAWNFVGPVEQTINNMELVSPDYRMISLPENGRVDMSYFNTVTFVGDSLTQGFQIYAQGIPNAHYCAYKGIGPKQIYDGSVQRRNDGEQEVPMEALVASAPDNVYIQLGANAMVSLDDDSIIAYYREMLTVMRASLHPEVGYYIQSLTPVRPDNSPGFDMARIDNLNNMLARMAFEEGIYFLDLTEPLAGDDLYLREDFAGSDGYHLSPSGYAAWVEYLVTHTAYHPRNPYLEGSPYYTGAPPEPIPEPVPEPEPAPAPAEAAPAPEEVPPAEASPAETPPAEAPAAV
ncbi:GDSL-type esterase/lipase family protein [Ruminococcaceae bacterium OttesenSCG-928-I18]|nr:GDSL-type esterase/lipase family protein [Ruminococcaceae bacterium OttesenSCG-928-I18]